MSQPICRLLIASAILAIGWAQAFGMHRGYFCDCAGSGHLTLFDHCHASAPGAHHHEDDDHDLPHHHECPDDEDTHSHPAVVDSLVAHQAGLHPIQIPPLMPVDAGWDWQSLPLIAQADTAARDAPDWRLLRRSPLAEDWPRLLSQTISLRL